MKCNISQIKKKTDIKIATPEAEG